MMHTLALSASQAAQLAECCAAYRAYAWRELPPSAERNQTMKAVQAVQGRLSAWRAAVATEPLRLAVSEEEKQALRQMTLLLMQVAGAQAPSEKRTQMLGELAGLRQVLERALRQTQAL
jgi:hypothetical protein